MRKAADPSTNPTQTMRQVRCLVLRNKADIIGKSDELAAEALQLYQQALGVDSTDVNLLHKMGVLVSSLPQLILSARQRLTPFEDQHCLECLLAVSLFRYCILTRILVSELCKSAKYISEDNF